MLKTIIGVIFIIDRIIMHEIQVNFIAKKNFFVNGIEFFVRCLDGENKSEFIDWKMDITRKLFEGLVNKEVLFELDIVLEGNRTISKYPLFCNKDESYTISKPIYLKSICDTSKPFSCHKIGFKATEGTFGLQIGIKCTEKLQLANSYIKGGLLNQMTGQEQNDDDEDIDEINFEQRKFEETKARLSKIIIGGKKKHHRFSRKMI